MILLGLQVALSGRCRSQAGVALDDFRSQAGVALNDFRSQPAALEHDAVKRVAMKQ